MAKKQGPVETGNLNPPAEEWELDWVKKFGIECGRAFHNITEHVLREDVRVSLEYNEKLVIEKFNEMQEEIKSLKCAMTDNEARTRAGEWDKVISVVRGYKGHLGDVGKIHAAIKQAFDSEKQLAADQKQLDDHAKSLAIYVDNDKWYKEQLAAAHREAESNDRQSTMLSTKLQEMTAKYNVAEAARKRNLEQLAAANARVAELDTRDVQHLFDHHGWSDFDVCINAPAAPNVDAYVVNAMGGSNTTATAAPAAPLCECGHLLLAHDASGCHRYGEGEYGERCICKAFKAKGGE